jgi:hypothetical protein
LGLGLLFLVGMGVIHHIQEGHTAFFYQAITWSRIPALLVGLGLIAYIVKYYSTNSTVGHQTFAIPILIILTAMLLQIYQQTCIPNFSLVFRQWLDSQQYSFAKRGIYEIIYQLLYLLPLFVFVLFIIGLRNHKWLNRFQFGLTQAAWCILIIIAAFFIFYPEGLSSLALSFVTLILALLTGWLLATRKLPRV